MIINNRKKGKFVLEKADLTESTDQLNNPGRGWYQIYTFYLPEVIDYQSLRGSLNPDESLSLVIINIGKYREKELDLEALERVEEILTFFEREKKDVILRFVYDSEGKGIEREPLLFSYIERHIKQLMPITQSHTGTVFILQGMLIGSWGEMHSSKFLAATFLRKLKVWMEEAAGRYTWLAVRRPVYWRMLHQEVDERNLNVESRMGLFDDAILGSDTDMGTFGNQRKGAVGWNSPWCAEEELRFEEILCHSVPNGGEAVYPVNGVIVPAEKVIKRLRQMHISYLNCIHDPKLIAQWKIQKSVAAFPWNQCSLYEYIGAHLGYRYCIRNVSLTQLHGEQQLDVEIENLGFAPCYEQYIVLVEIRDCAGTMVSWETNWDLRTISAGEKMVFSEMLPIQKGDLYISAVREKDDRRLYFANNTNADGQVLLGMIL